MGGTTWGHLGCSKGQKFKGSGVSPQITLNVFTAPPIHPTFINFVKFINVPMTLYMQG